MAGNNKKITAPDLENSFLAMRKKSVRQKKSK